VDYDQALAVQLPRAFLADPDKLVRYLLSDER